MTSAIHRLPLWARIGALGYWGAFAVWTLWAARQPGLVAPGSRPPYPWQRVVWTWGVLAVATAVLVATLAMPRVRHFWARLLLALALSFLFFAEEGLTASSDQSGEYYVPGEFALVTTGVLLVWMLGYACWKWSRRSGSAQDGAKRGPTGART